MLWKLRYLSTSIQPSIETIEFVKVGNTSKLQTVLSLSSVYLCRCVFAGHVSWLNVWSNVWKVSSLMIFPGEPCFHERANEDGHHCLPDGWTYSLLRPKEHKAHRLAGVTFWNILFNYGNTFLLFKLPGIQSTEVSIWQGEMLQALWQSRKGQFHHPDQENSLGEKE